MPNPGTFTLHSNAVPPLPAGGYVAHLRQTITAPGASPEQVDSHFEVTAPRFALTPDQILSTFPPNQAEGAFSSRLPHIVLKRRTLPWERELDGKNARSALPREIPWLALVVLADAECEFRTAKPVAECVTPGVVLEGRNDVVVGNAIVVTDRVVSQVFPSKLELGLLAHVRNVDLSDTELALGDDDGWLAVVMANRLPQPGVRYRACLISIEGQYGVLPDAVVPEDRDAMMFAAKTVYENEARGVDTLSYTHGARVGARSLTTADGWSSKKVVAGTSSTGASQPSEPTLRTGAIVGVMHTVDMAIIDPVATLYTFPVLAHWQFTCTGAGDFQSLIQNLDVGMTGTLPRELPPVQAGEKPHPPPTRDPPVVVDTGHIALQHVSRNGDPATVWYRGPLVPRPTRRDERDAQGRLPLLHASDQARRVGPDGRENLSLAAAFEIGRLLALAEPGVVAALLNWRKEMLEQDRRAELLDAEPSLGKLGIGDFMGGYARRAGHEQIVRLGTDQAKRLGRVRPRVDEGRPIAEIDNADLTQLLATGFGVSADVVRELIQPGVVRTELPEARVAKQVRNLDRLVSTAGKEFASLRRAAESEVTAIVADALEARAAPVGRGDALDKLLKPEGR
jgi:hypothetical protein